MNAARDETYSLLEALPSNTTLEDAQYHLYLLEKIKRSVEHGKAERGFHISKL
jgi:hypothetical protein